MYYGLPQSLKHASISGEVVVDGRKIVWREIAGTHGEVLEDYIWELFIEFWPGHVARTSKHPGQVDFILSCNGIILLIEVKSSRINAAEFLDTESFAGLSSLIKERVLSKAVSQLSNSLRMLQDGKSRRAIKGAHPRTAHIIPVLITDQVLPESGLLFDHFFGQAAMTLSQSFESLTVTSLRILKLSDLERCLSRGSPKEFSAFMLQWSQSKHCRLDFTSAAEELHYKPADTWRSHAIDLLKSYLIENGLLESSTD